MASKRSTQSYEAFPMNGGNHKYSYAQNSTLQKNRLDISKNLIKEAILEKLDSEALFQNSSNIFCIADLGCSTGPNTFFAVQNIIDAMNLKLQSHGNGLDPLEFQVFFNDHVDNDFNTLFKSLPAEKQYYAAAAPGSFHGRLFPESSIHFFHSSYALHWLSKIPEEIVDNRSPAYNKGKIYFTTTTKDVKQAYSAQFARDMDGFLNSRALELASGGLVAFHIPCVPPYSKNRFEAFANLLEDSLLDMVTKGIINEELVDSFNFPAYAPAPEEVKALIENNGNFSIEKMEPLISRNLQEPNANMLFMHIRAVCEGIVKQHFGEEVVEEILEHFKKKLAESGIHTDPDYKPVGELFVIKRKLF